MFSGNPRNVRGLSLNVCHIISGDLWAGAACQVVNLLSELTKDERTVLSAITFNPGRLTDELEMMGLDVTSLSESRLSSHRILLGILKHLKEHTPDIVHCHGHKEQILGCTANLLSGGHARVVRTLHGMPEPYSGSAGIRAAFFDRVQDFCMNHLTEKVIVVSEDMRHRLSEKHWAGKISCIHNGIDCSRVRTTVSRDEMRRRLDIRNGDFIIGTACRLVPIKRIDLLLEGFRAVKRDHPEASLVICGDGPLLLKMKEYSAALGVAGSVRFLGHRDDIYDVMSAFDVFVMTSEHEGIPMVLLEALALGLPLVAPDVGGIPEIAEGTHATLFEPLSVQSLHNTLLAQVNAKSRSTDTPVSVDESVLDRISVTLTAKKVVELYRQIGNLPGMGTI